MKSAVRNEKKLPIVKFPSMTSLPPMMTTAATPTEPKISIIGLTISFTFTLFKFSLKNLAFSSVNLACSNSCALFALMISMLVKISLSLELISEVFSCEAREIFFIFFASLESG